MNVFFVPSVYVKQLKSTSKMLYASTRTESVMHRPHLRPIGVVQPFHPAGVGLLRRNICPLVGPLVAGDSLMCRAPSDFDDDDTRPGPSQRGDVLLRLESILLPRARFIRCHPSDGCPRGREDCDP